MLEKERAELFDASHDNHQNFAPGFDWSILIFAISVDFENGAFCKNAIDEVVVM